ncbi:hypothetical protein A3F06_00185 [candidate division TM6 bacterium RIFCSPHIGHO2_12_FULL_36_22]|nr:MAG: hypothetical protein A3F06_00185 [candidate division TM6 bacterium RIFCSPHIGHO2_12_FULL_36_22]
MALVIEVKVVPSSGRNKWVLETNGTLKCFLKSQPERGRANQELLKLIAKVAGVPMNDVYLLSGDKQKNKRVKIDSQLSYEQFLARIGIEHQTSVF